MKYLRRLDTNQRLAALAFVLGLGAIAASPAPARSVAVVPADLAASIDRKGTRIAPPELADWIIQGRSDFRLVDLRPEAEYAAYQVPGAENVPLGRLADSDLARNEKIVVYGRDGVQAAQGWFLLKALGYRGVYVLDGGLEGWKDLVLFPRLQDATTAEARQQNDLRRSVSLHFGGTPLAAGEGGAASLAAAPPPMPSVPVVQSPSGKGAPAKKKRKEGC